MRIIKELIRKKDGYIPLTLGNFIDNGYEWIVYDGADYIGFSKDEYDLVEINKNKGEDTYE